MVEWKWGRARDGGVESQRELEGSCSAAGRSRDDGAIFRVGYLGGMDRRSAESERSWDLRERELG